MKSNAWPLGLNTALHANADRKNREDQGANSRTDQPAAKLLTMSIDQGFTDEQHFASSGKIPFNTTLDPAGNDILGGA